MKLLINDKEIANYLASLIEYNNELSSLRIGEDNVNSIIGWILMIKENEKKFNKHKPKILSRIEEAVRNDLTEYVNQAKLIIQNKKEKTTKVIRFKLDSIIDTIGEDVILESYKKSKVENYVKSIGLSIDKKSTLVRRNTFTDVNEDCVLRNTVGNESFLVDKIDNNKPFWFIDSGYTNFLEGKKKVWHRLVRNHLHIGHEFQAPVDRLGIFKTFPQQWRTSGDRILVIEPGPFAAAIFHVDVKQWKYNVEKELRQYTDKKIVFREKVSKKTRESLYDHLLNEDYHCVININSNAATESVWAGIPIITLDKHITNPISRSKLSDVNNLYTGSLANWLAMLSYSQFTFKELADGTALSIIKKYHE